MFRDLFEASQFIVMHGRSKERWTDGVNPSNYGPIKTSDSFWWYYIVYPLGFFVFCIFWLFQDPKSFFKHFFTKEAPEEPKPKKIIPLEEMPSTLTDLEEHPKEWTFVMEYVLEDGTRHTMVETLPGKGAGSKVETLPDCQHLEPHVEAQMKKDLQKYLEQTQ